MMMMMSPSGLHPATISFTEQKCQLWHLIIITVNLFNGNFMWFSTFINVLLFTFSN